MSAESGYRLVLSTKLQRYHNTLQTKYFEKTNESPPLGFSVLTVSGCDRVQITSQDEYHSELVESLNKIIKQNWSGYVAEREKTKYFKNWSCTEFNLGVSVWSNATCQNLTRGRFLLSHIITKLAKSDDWHFYTRANLKNKGDDIWFYKNSLLTTDEEYAVSDLPLTWRFYKSFTKMA